MLRASISAIILMDRALQERVIGAIVLVVLAVLIVPVFLDGPANDTETVVESVTLPGQNTRQPVTKKIVLNRDRTEPVPAKAPVAAPQSAPGPDQREPPQSARPSATTADRDSAAVPVSSTGMWAVQLGSFSNQENAERLAASLRTQGYAAFLSKLETATASLHRVRIGPQKDRDSAESVAVQLGKAGHTGQVVPYP